MTAAETIRDMRIKANVTQAAVAKHWGRSCSLLCLFESGQRTPSTVQLEAIKKAIAAASTSELQGLTDYERKVYDELESIRPKQRIEPPLRDRIRLVRLWSKMRLHGIGGERGLTVVEVTKLVLLLERFRMTPASRGVVFEKLTQIAI